MKHVKHTILILFILTFNTVVLSQQRGGNRNFSQQGQQGNIMQPKANPENMARIIMYDIDEVLKKMKIKNAPKKAIVSKAISKHNNKINEIKAFNYETFDKVKSFLTKKRNEAKLSRDFSMMKESRMQANEMLAPIRKKVLNQQTILNTKLEQELTEKQYKSWLKYQKNTLKKLKPKISEKPQMQSGQRSKGS